MTQNFSLLIKRGGLVLGTAAILGGAAFGGRAQDGNKETHPRRLASAVSPRTEQDAQAVLRRVQQTLKSAQTLTAEFTASSEYPTFYRDSLERGTIALAKPDKVAVRLDRYRKLTAASGWTAMGNHWESVSDGAKWGSLTAHPDSAQHRLASAPASAETLLESIEALRGFFAEQNFAPKEARLLGERVWEGQKYTVVETQMADNTMAQIFVGADGLIHRYLAQTVISGKPVLREVTLQNIRLNPSVDAKTFAFTPPADSQPVERTAPAKTLTAGDDAPDFAVQDKDGKPVRLSDFKGRTVVLKFFATWCGSCRQSLPHTQEVTAKYADKGVAALAVDIWDSPKALKKWQEKQGSQYSALRFAVDPAPQGKDIATRLYGVRTTPTVFVIAPTGKITAVLAGYDGPTPSLEDAITKASAK